MAWKRKNLKHPKTMACCENQIISLATVRDVTGLSETIKDRKLAPFMKLAQAELEKVLGRTLYDELDAAIQADDTLATETDLLALMPYIKMALSWRTLQRALPRLSAEPTANGVHSVNSGEYQNVDGRALSMQVSDARSAADAEYERLIEFLKNNRDTYATYDTVVENEERIKKPYVGGVITRKSRWQYPYGIKGITGVNDRRNQYDECCDAD